MTARPQGSNVYFPCKKFRRPSGVVVEHDESDLHGETTQGGPTTFSCRHTTWQSSDTAPPGLRVNN